MIEIEIFNINRNKLNKIHYWAKKNNIECNWDEYDWNDYYNEYNYLQTNCTMGKFYFKNTEDALLFKLRWL